MSLKESLLAAATIPDSWRDFCPGSWKIDGDQLEDLKTKKVYRNGEQYLSTRELAILPRVECAALACMYPLYGIVGGVMHVFARVVNIFKANYIPEVSHPDSRVRKFYLFRFTRNIAKIILTLIALVAMQISLIYAIVVPRDGKKLYASLERAFFGGYVNAYYQSLYERCPPLQPIKVAAPE